MLGRDICLLSEWSTSGLSEVADSGLWRWAVLGSGWGEGGVVGGE